MLCMLPLVHAVFSQPVQSLGRIEAAGQAENAQLVARLLLDARMAADDELEIGERLRRLMAVAEQYGTLAQQAEQSQERITLSIRVVWRTDGFD